MKPSKSAQFALASFLVYFGLFPNNAKAADPLIRLDGHQVAALRVARLPASSETLRFVVYGDTRDGADVEPRIVARIVDEAPDLLLYTGDLVPTGSDDAGWQNFFTVEEPLLSRFPVLFAVGNHELYEDPQGGRFMRYVVQPGALSDGARPGLYYEERVGDVVFLVLDGMDRFHEQALWLESRLQAAQASHARHVFVVLHQPPFSVGSHCGAAVIQAEWVTLFERYGVRAVFAGHDHAYERLERNGVRYFVSGGGGAPLYPEESNCPPYDAAAKRTYRAEHHYLRVELHGDVVQVTALPLDARAPPLEVTRFDTTPAAASWGPPIVRVPRNALTTRAAAHFGLAGATLLAVVVLVLLLVRGRRRLATAKGA